MLTSDLRATYTCKFKRGRASGKSASWRLKSASCQIRYDQPDVRLAKRAHDFAHAHAHALTYERKHSERWYTSLATPAPRVLTRSCRETAISTSRRSRSSARPRAHGAPAAQTLNAGQERQRAGDAGRCEPAALRAGRGRRPAGVVLAKLGRFTLQCVHVSAARPAWQRRPN